jgi:hypothetical protein
MLLYSTYSVLVVKPEGKTPHIDGRIISQEVPGRNNRLFSFDTIRMEKKTLRKADSNVIS